MFTMPATRRDFLGASLAGGAAALAGGAVRGAEAPRRALRIAHLTDIHVQTLPDRGEAAADLIVTGGDTVMECMAAG